MLRVVLSKLSALEGIFASKLRKLCYGKLNFKVIKGIFILFKTEKQNILIKCSLVFIDFHKCVRTQSNAIVPCLNKKYRYEVPK